VTAPTEHEASNGAARGLPPGAVVALEGDLGVGKTQFARGIVEGLGGDPMAVSSPTFVLMNIYDTPRGKVYHLDAYRISGAEDLEGIGFEELLDQNGFVLVEWWQKVRELIPQKHWTVYMESTSQRGRTIRIASES
jgi:tRNA threonylcarbamoyl adenosine modification protein YjeE